MVSSVEEKMAMMTIQPPRKKEEMVMSKKMGVNNGNLRRLGVSKNIKRRMGVSY